MKPHVANSTRLLLTFLSRQVLPNLWAQKQPQYLPWSLHSLEASPRRFTVKARALAPGPGPSVTPTCQALYMVLECSCWRGWGPLNLSFCGRSISWFQSSWHNWNQSFQSVLKASLCPCEPVSLLAGSLICGSWVYCHCILWTWGQGPVTWVAFLNWGPVCFPEMLSRIPIKLTNIRPFPFLPFILHVSCFSLWRLIKMLRKIESLFVWNLFLDDASGTKLCISVCFLGLLVAPC